MRLWPRPSPSSAPSGRSLVLVCAILISYSTLSLGAAETYTLSFSKSSDRMSWRPSVPGWRYSVPVALVASGDTTSRLSLSANTSMGATLTERSGSKTWQDNVSINSSINYPILGPKASIGMTARMSSRSSTLVNQRIRSQSFGFRFSYSPFAGRDGTFKNMKVSLTPSLVTAGRATRASLDSTIEEKGVQYSASLSVSPALKIGGQKVSPSFHLSKSDNTLKTNKKRSESLRLSGSYKLAEDLRASLKFSEGRSEKGLTRAIIDTALLGNEVVNDTKVSSELSETRTRRVNTGLKFRIAGFDFNSKHDWSQSLNTNTANAAEDAGNEFFFARDRETAGWKFGLDANGKLPAGLVARATFQYDMDSFERLPVRLASGGSCPPPTRQIAPGICRDPSDDRDNRDLTVSGSLDFQAARDHKLTLFGSSILSRGDNPGDPRRNRDTATGEASVRYSGKFISGLSLGSTLSVTDVHYISLDATQSSENHRRRDLRLRINTSYQRLETNLSHGFEISARRTIFDFDRELNEHIIDRRSTIRRSWTMKHSASRSLLEGLRLKGNFSYSADDLGTLLLDRRAQIVEQDKAKFSFGTSMNYRVSDELSCAVNYSSRFDRQWKWTYPLGGPERELSDRIRHRNLAVSTNYNPGGETSMKARASRSRQRSGTFDSFSVTLTRRV